jgi:hypothetical protein
MKQRDREGEREWRKSLKPEMLLRCIGNIEIENWDSGKDVFTDRFQPLLLV